MAYNPFDDVIENDPAYKMQTGGVERTVIPQKRADYSQGPTAAPVANVITRALQFISPEPENLEQIQRNEQLRSLSTAQALKGTDYEEYAGRPDLPSFVIQAPGIKERLDEAGFIPQSAFEGVSRIGDFLAGDERRAFEKFSRGEKLEQSDINAAAMTPLLAFDAVGLGALGTKLVKFGFKTINDVLKSTSKDPDVLKIQSAFGGSPKPLIQDAAEGVPGMQTTPRVALAAEDGTGAGATTKVKTKLIDRPDDIKKIQDIIAAEKKKTGKELTIVDAAALLKKKAPELPTSNQSLSNLLKEGIDLGITNIYRPTKAETNLVTTNANKLADIIKQKLPENKGLSSKELVEKYGFDNLLQRNRGAQTGLKTRAKSILNAIPGYKEEQFAIRSKTAGEKRRAGTDPDLKATLNDFINQDFTFDSVFALGERLSVLNKGSRRAIIDRRNDPEFKPLLDILIQEPERGTQIKDVFFNTYDKIPMEKKLEFLGVKSNKLNDFDRDTLESIQQLASNQGIQKEFSINTLFRDFLQFRYRGIKDAKDFEKLTPQQFFKKLKFDSKDIEKLRSEFKSFLGLEETRLAMQQETREFLEELGNIPEYRKYLLDSKGKLDLKLVGVDKAHDTPLFITRVEGKGRLKNIGRFINLGTEPEFLNPSFQAYNNMQVKFDPAINKLADLRQNKVLQDKAKKMDFSLTTKHKNRAGKYIIPKDRLDFISEEFVALLNQKGAGINLDDFAGKNQYEFLTAIDKAIDKIYKERGIRTIVPVRIGKGGKKDFEFFGVPDMKAIPNEARVELFKKKLLDELNYAVENNVPVEVFKNEGGFIRTLKRGGISMVRGGMQMAIGGQNFTENMNKQDFTPDPAIDGDSAFQQAVQSGNLQALNLPKIFKGLGEAFGVFTPKKVGKPLTGEMSAVSPVVKSDFPLQSFTLEKINNLNIQSARPQDWINELQGGAPAPKSELLDSGLFQYLADFEKYFPNQKVSKDKLVEFLENNPISNLKIKIKGSETGDPAYDSYMGRPRHKNAGSARMDQAGEDYREVILEAGTLPGQQTGDEFVNSSHFQEKNVLAFGRVGTYKNSAGDNVAVIQEMQTDYLTQVRKEQELLNAEIEKLNLQKTKAEQRLERADNPYDTQRANESLSEVNSKLPALLKLQESKLIKPYPNVAAADKIPEFNKQLQDLQKQINNLSMQGVRRENPEFLMQISNLEEQQKQVLNQLLDLNRANEYEMLAKDVKVPDIDDRNSLLSYINGSDYVSMKNVKTFPPTPLNNQADYVDAILKAVIKDAENRGINKIAIMPADVGANARWGKESEDAKRKFRNLYDKVGVQRLKDIAKKYGGTVEEEFVVDSTKGSLGLRFLNKGVDGNFQVLKETDIDPSVTIRREDLGPSKPPEGLNAFLNEEILRVAKDYGPNEVVFRREIAPGQTMEYFVNVKQGDVVDQKFDLVPLGDADRAENATIVIEEYNPQLVKMNVLVLPDSNKDKPMYLFKKKKGGIMPDDRLVSITDIYGDY